MLDISFIPNTKQDTRIFYAAGSSASTATWQTWIKPRGAKFIQIFCLGGGSPGAGGGANVAATGGNGGGGGGNSGYFRGYYPAFLLPDILYVFVGVGGPGGIGSSTAGNGAAGTQGGLSYVAISPSTNAIGVIAQSGNTNPAVGNPTGAATVAQTAWATTSSPFTLLGIFNIIAGIAGAAQNTGTSALATMLTTPGCGGGSKPANSQTAGGTVVSASAILLTQLDGGAVGGGAGKDGYGSMAPLCGTGGSGGGGNLTGNGGKGGDGWYGCGGAGGGCGLQGGRGGNGGRGGDGLVIITTIF
jgi:hypothetical protein